MLRCCKRQKLKLQKWHAAGDHPGDIPVYVCLYCGRVLTRDFTEDSCLVWCADNILADLRRKNGLGHIADVREASLNIRRRPV